MAVSIQLLLILISIYGLYQVAEGMCLGTGCTCYTRMPRVDCDKGFASLLPDRVKRLTEKLVLDHVTEGSLDLLNIQQNWPSLKKIVFNQCSAYVVKWLEYGTVPRHVYISNPCHTERDSDTISSENDVDGKTTSVDGMTVKHNVRGLITEGDDLLQDMDSYNTTTEAYYTVDIAMSREGLIVTVVIPISFIIVASLTLYIKWRRSEPSRLALAYRLTKARYSPPPETASLVDSSEYVADHDGLHCASGSSQQNHAGKLILEYPSVYYRKMSYL